MRNVTELKDIGEAVHYWRQCVDQEKQGKPVVKVASSIVNIWANDDIYNWYDSARYPSFRLLLDLAENLEVIQEDNEKEIASMWRMIKVYLLRLEEEVAEYGQNK